MKKSILLIGLTILCTLSKSNAQKPDLIVKSITPTWVGDNLRLRIRIKNIGNGNAVGNFKNYIELNNITEPSPNPNRIKTRTIAGLNAGQVKIINVFYSGANVLEGDTKVTVITDSKISRIDELNESNNKRQTTIPPR
jgi:hypothetical protein